MKISVNNQSYEMSKTAMAQAYAASKGHEGGAKVTKALLTLTFAPNSAKSKRIKEAVAKAVQTLEKKQESAELRDKSIISSDNKNFEISRGEVSITKEGLGLLSSDWKELKTKSKKLLGDLEWREQEINKDGYPLSKFPKEMQDSRRYLSKLYGIMTEKLESKISKEDFQKLTNVWDTARESLSKCLKRFQVKYDQQKGLLAKLKSKVSELNRALEKGSSKSFQLRAEGKELLHQFCKVQSSPLGEGDDAFNKALGEFQENVKTLENAVAAVAPDDVAGIKTSEREWIAQKAHDECSAKLDEHQKDVSKLVKEFRLQLDPNGIFNENKRDGYKNYQEKIRKIQDPIAKAGLEKMYSACWDKARSIQEKSKDSDWERSQQLAKKLIEAQESGEDAEANIEKVKNEFMANSSDLLSSEKSKLDQELQKLDAAITAAEVTFDTSTLSVDAQNALKTLDECSKLICDFEREVDELEKLKPFSPDHLLQDADKATKEKLSNLYSTLGKVQFPKIREIRAVMAQIYDLQEEIKNNGEGKDGDLPDVKTFQDNLSKELAEKMYFLKRDYVGPLKAYKEAIYDGDNPPIDRA